MVVYHRIIQLGKKKPWIRKIDHLKKVVMILDSDRMMQHEIEGKMKSCRGGLNVENIQTCKDDQFSLMLLYLLLI